MFTKNSGLQEEVNLGELMVLFHNIKELDKLSPTRPEFRQHALKTNYLHFVGRVAT